MIGACMIGDVVIQRGNGRKPMSHLPFAIVRQKKDLMFREDNII